ncbi:hypothetical protein POM88_046636 [Heracleum sosnowskyi]|uniref:Uncharacterized protein n=1 Tax=Heracleum sosnowskyi TaxID=360622 RepID=A0AAD8M7B4_9APIA|nr:hypothetical protein POM88_046636 [Heracleum sosnowskyi]
MRPMTIFAGTITGVAGAIYFQCRKYLEEAEIEKQMLLNIDQKMDRLLVEARELADKVGEVRKEVVYVGDVLRQVRDLLEEKSSCWHFPTRFSHLLLLQIQYNSVTMRPMTIFAGTITGVAGAIYFGCRKYLEEAEIEKQMLLNIDQKMDRLLVEARELCDKARELRKEVGYVGDLVIQVIDLLEKKDGD